MAKIIRTNVLYEDATTDTQDLQYEVNTTSNNNWTNFCINTTNILDMPVFLDNIANWFNGCNKLKEVNFSDNTVISNKSNYANSAYAFSDCTMLNYFPVNLNNGVVNGYAMYQNCTNINKNFMEANALMEGGCLYNNCRNIKGNIPVIDTLVNAQNMYRNCIGIIGQAEYGVNLSNAQNMYRDCIITNKNDIVNTNIIDSSYMFYGCTQLGGNFETPVNAINISNMYSMAGTNIDNPHYLSIANKVEDMSNAFYRVKNITGLNFGTNVVTNAAYAFELTNATSDAQFPVYIPNTLVNACHMFNKSTLNIAITFADTLAIENCINMFNDCYRLFGEPKCSDLVQNTYCMYNNCSNLTGNASVGNNVIIATNMYQNCIGLTGAPACPENLQIADNMYNCCNNLDGNVNIGNHLYNAAYMYNGCVNLIGNISIPAEIANMCHMFDNCHNIYTDGNYNLIDKDYLGIQNVYSAFYGCYNTLYFTSKANTDIDNVFWNNGYRHILGDSINIWKRNNVGDDFYYGYELGGYQFRVFDGVVNSTERINTEDSGSMQQLRAACHEAATSGPVRFLLNLN